MGGICSKEQAVAPTQDQHTSPHLTSPFETSSGNAVVAFSQAEEVAESAKHDPGHKTSAASGRSGQQHADTLIPGRSTRIITGHEHQERSQPCTEATVAVLGTLASLPASNTDGVQQDSKGGSRQHALGKVNSMGTQTADDWLDWVAASVLESRTPTMPASWRKGGSIGSGSFGAVFLALNNDTGELLAVKEVALGGVAKEQEAVEQLEHEVAVLSSLRHPNIVTYVGTVREGDTLLIFLEYVPGGSISSLLARFGPLAEPAIRCFTRQLLEGLAYLHEQRTVHRDVKGANLLVETSGHVKLADFGMAKQMVEAASFTQSFKGSAFWMAPEVIRQQGYGVAADIWSLGCTVLEMATGKPPWAQCTTQIQAIFKIASSGELPTIPQSLSPQASEFILLCLQRDPAKRPSAQALLQHPWIQQNPSQPAVSQGLGAWRQAQDAHPAYLREAIRRAPAKQGPARDSPTSWASLNSTPSALVSVPTAQHARNAPAQPGGQLQPSSDMLSDGEMSDALAAMVLGSNMRKPGAGKRGVRASEGGAHAGLSEGPDGRSSSSQPEDIDFTAKPSTFKVQGLLKLPPLKLTTSGAALPSLQLTQQLIPSVPAQSATGQ